MTRGALMEKKTLGILITNTVCCVGMIVGMAVLMRSMEWYFQLIIYGIAILGLIAEFVFAFWWKKESLFKLVFVIELCVLLVFLLFLIFKLTGVISSMKDAQKIVELVRGTGAWGMVVYVLIQVLQVVVLPLPAFIFYVSGTYLYGAGIATLLASIGVLIGSLISFSIGKVFGLKVVSWIAGKEETAKYRDLLGRKGKTIFVIMQILPFFPDDLLCMVAGLTSMSYLFFATVMVLIRPAIIAVYCYLGSGDIIPFDQPWGIAVWVVIIVVCVALAVLSFFYQEKIENWIKKKFAKKGKPRADLAVSEVATTPPPQSTETLNDAAVKEDDQPIMTAQQSPDESVVTSEQPRPYTESQEKKDGKQKKDKNAPNT